MTDDDFPRFVHDLFGFYSFLNLGVGQRTGLLAALVTSPGTPAEVAGRAGVDERNALEWLRAMVAGGHATHAGGVFTVTAEDAGAFAVGRRDGAPAILEANMSFLGIVDDVVAAIRHGQGIPDAVFHEHVPASGVGGVNTPIYAGALVDDWLAGVPGLTERLTAGIRVADIAGGNGDAAALIAMAFPASTVVSIDLDSSVAGRIGLPDNVTQVTGNAADLVAHGPFELVICLDSIHHFGAPEPVLEAVRTALASGGTLLVADSDATGDLDADVENPFAIVAAVAGLFYCLQDNLGSGGAGYSGLDGSAWIAAAMTTAGFRGVDRRQSPAGYDLITGTA